MNDTRYIFDILVNTKNRINFLKKTNNKSYSKHLTHIETFNSLFTQCMTMANSILSNSFSDTVLDNPRILLNKVNTAILQETNSVDNTISNSGTILKNNYEKLVNTGRILLGLFNIDNLPCAPCSEDEDGTTECKSC